MVTSRSSLTLLLLLFSLLAFSQSKTERAVTDVLQNQTDAWNNGNLKAFMQTYWHSDSLSFVGKTGVTKGWQNTLKRYQKAYPDTATMGKLHFSNIKIQKLSSRYCNVVGKWTLKRTIGDLYGHYTLLFKKVKGKWLIVQDHSS